MANTQDTPRKGGRFKWILVFFLLALLAAAAAGAWYFFFSGKFGGDEPAVEPPAARGETYAPLSGSGRVVALKPYTTNLSDPLGRRFIKLTLALEVAGEQVEKELQQHEARVSDSILMLLSSKSYADIATMESKLLLKNEITARLNQILGGPKIQQVFITDLVIQ